MTETNSLATFSETSASSKATLTSLKVVLRSFSVIAPLLESDLKIPVNLFVILSSILK